MPTRIGFLAVTAAALLMTPARADEQPSAGDTDPAAMFAQLDANKDGQLAGDEVAEQHKRLFERLLRTADKNDDGKLSGDEFAAGLAGTPEEPKVPPREREKRPDRERAGRFFERLDANGDGKVALDEVPEERRVGFKKIMFRADKDGDGALTREEFGQARPDGAPVAKAEKPAGPEAVKEARKFFKRLDQNADGKIALDEVPDERRDRFKKLMERGDKDGDNALSREEFAQASPGDEGQPQAEKNDKRPDGAPKGRPDGKSFFDRFDGNSDGKVTLDEVPEQARPRLEGLMRRADKDGDGAVTREELDAVRPPGQPGRPRPEGRPSDRPGRPPGLFGALDTDHDGKLSGGEISAAAEAIRKLDGDGDGSVSVEEVGLPGPKPEKGE